MEPWAANLPIIVRETDTPATFERYPGHRAIGRGSTGNGTGTNTPTWQAVNDGGQPVALDRVGSAISDFRGFIATITTPDPTIILTGGRPRNPIGGVLGYTVTLGTATLTDGGPAIASNAVYEDRQPVLSGNTLVECRKLPIATPGQSAVYANPVYGGTPLISPINNFINDGQAYASRWTGGDFFVSLSNNAGVNADIYLVPITPGTLTGDIASAVFLTTAVDGVIQTVTAAMIAATGIVRWDQFWVIPIATFGPADPASIFQLGFYVATDFAPLYDCAGYDIALLKGGYVP